jgi:hypothetical protein
VILRSAYYLLIVLLALSSCGVLSLEVKDIDWIEMEVLEDQEVNHGSDFTVKFSAITKKGSRKKLNEKHGVIVSSPEIEQLEWNRLKIIDVPEDFKNTSYPVVLTLQDEDKKLIASTNIFLNYKGNININAIALDGIDGIQGDDGGQTLFGRNGTEGKPGANGTDGANGDHYTIHIWKDGYEYRMRIEDDSTGTIWKYKSIDCDELFFDMSGGHGGAGGRGGEGGIGKPGKVTDSKQKKPGDGGFGGNGGNGGAGGNGGSALIFIHPNAKEIKERIRIVNYGGTGGQGGLPGEGGVPGRPGKGQKPAKHGTMGKVGQQGEDGIDGPESTISIISFDFKLLESQ